MIALNLPRGLFTMGFMQVLVSRKAKMESCQKEWKRRGEGKM